MEVEYFKALIFLNVFISNQKEKQCIS